MKDAFGWLFDQYLFRPWITRKGNQILRYKVWYRRCKKIDLNQDTSLWQDNAVELNLANQVDLVKINIIALDVVSLICNILHADDDARSTTRDKKKMKILSVVG